MKSWVAILFLFLLVNCEETCEKDGTCEDSGSSQDLYKELPFCDETSKLGHMDVDLKRHSMRDIERRYSALNVTSGGMWSPEFSGEGEHRVCRSRHHIAIVVPYRDRADDLLVFLNHMHAFMQAQRNTYVIILAEQTDKKNFNRGYLLNVGAMHALTAMPGGASYDCLVMHDVDKFPENTKNSYVCDPNVPRHLIGKIAYEGETTYRREPYPNYFGGVTSISPQKFMQINGYSNKFFGWGSEDDDFYNRIKHHKLSTTRTNHEIGGFKEIYHPYGFVNPRRHELVQEGKKLFDKDGVRFVSFKMKTSDGILQHSLYTKIPVELTVEDPYADLTNKATGDPSN